MQRIKKNPKRSIRSPTLQRNLEVGVWKQTWLSQILAITECRCALTGLRIIGIWTRTELYGTIRTAEIDLLHEINDIENCHQGLEQQK